MREWPRNPPNPRKVDSFRHFRSITQRAQRRRERRDVSVVGNFHVVPDEASRSDAKIRDLDNEAAVSTYLMPFRGPGSFPWCRGRVPVGTAVVIVIPFERFLLPRHSGQVTPALSRGARAGIQKPRRSMPRWLLFSWIPDLACGESGMTEVHFTPHPHFLSVCFRGHLSGGRFFPPVTSGECFRHRHSGQATRPCAGGARAGIQRPRSSMSLRLMLFWIPDRCCAPSGMTGMKTFRPDAVWEASAGCGRIVTTGRRRYADGRPRRGPRPPLRRR